MKFLREPLVHFLIIGAALFGIFSVVGQWNIDRPGQVVVSSKQIEALCTAFQIDFGHWPDANETKKLIDDWVREEILVREAEKLQFQHDKQNIRILMARHMEAANEGDIQLPTDAELQKFLSEHSDMFHGNTNFEQIKPVVQNAWMAAQRKAARDAAYEKIKSHYIVSIEAAKPPTAPSTSPQK